MDRKNITESDLEKILRNSRFTNETHKAELKKRLMSGNFTVQKPVRQGFLELSLDELDMAAGGTAAAAEQQKKYLEK